MLLLHVLTDCSQMGRFDRSHMYVRDRPGITIDDFRAESSCMLGVVTVKVASQNVSALVNPPKIVACL